MVLSVGQKLKIYLIGLIISIIWTIDKFSILLNNSLILKYFSRFAILSLFGYFIVYPNISFDYINSYKKNVALIQNIYISSQYYNNNSDVINGRAQVLSASVPVMTEKKAFPFVSAKSYLVIDNASGVILAQNNIHVPFAPASTTKLLTAIVSLGVYSLDDSLSISESCSELESTKLWLPVGSAYKVYDLISSLLISSAADAGCALATSKIPEADFIFKMNEKAKSLGMTNSNFTNAVGLDGENGSHYSSAWDLYLLSNAALNNQVIKDIVKQKNASFTDIDGKLEVNIENTNKLLWEIPGSIGVKTGRTDEAGEVLIYRFSEDDKDISIVVMSSTDRFKDTKTLLEWALSSYSWN